MVRSNIPRSVELAASLAMGVCVGAFVWYFVGTRSPAPVYNSFTVSSGSMPGESATSVICDFSHLNWSDCRIELIGVEEGKSTVLHDCSFERNRALNPRISLTILETHTEYLVTIKRHTSATSGKQVLWERFGKDKTHLEYGSARDNGILAGPFIDGCIQIGPVGVSPNLAGAIRHDHLQDYEQQTRDLPGLRYILLRITP